MRRIQALVAGMALFTAMFLIGSRGTGETQKPRIAQPCKQCHAPDEKVLRGTLGGVSGKAGTIQVQVGGAAWLVRFDDETKLIGAEKFGKIQKEKEIAVTFSERDGNLYALSVSVKPPARLPEEMLIKVDALARLADGGPAKGNYTVIDSRPAPRYHEGHIPGAVNIYDADFDRNVDKLPKDREALLIFYCGGVT